MAEPALQKQLMTQSQSYIACSTPVVIRCHDQLQRLCGARTPLLISLPLCPSDIPTGTGSALSPHWVSHVPPHSMSQLHTYCSKISKTQEVGVGKKDRLLRCWASGTIPEAAIFFRMKNNTCEAKVNVSEERKTERVFFPLTNASICSTSI